MEESVTRCNSRPNASLSKDHLIDKCRAIQKKNKSLAATVDSLKRQLSAEISKSDVCTEMDNIEINGIFRECDKEVKQAYPDENSFQRLLWDQQQKYTSTKDPRGMRWHPTI